MLFELFGFEHELAGGSGIPRVAGGFVKGVHGQLALDFDRLAGFFIEEHEASAEASGGRGRGSGQHGIRPNSHHLAGLARAVLVPSGPGNGPVEIEFLAAQWNKRHKAQEGRGAGPGNHSVGRRKGNSHGRSLDRMAHRW
jgi:hypothetical protein